MFIDSKLGQHFNSSENELGNRNGKFRDGVQNTVNTVTHNKQIFVRLQMNIGRFALIRQQNNRIHNFGSVLQRFQFFRIRERALEQSVELFVHVAVINLK